MAKKGISSVDALHHTRASENNPQKRRVSWLCLFLIVSLLTVCISAVSADPSITADETTETSIVWNLSNLPETCCYSHLAFDGILVSDLYPNLTHIVQNNLNPGERHIISITDVNGVRYEAEAYTLGSQETWTWTQLNTWFYLILVIAIMVIALVVRRNPVLCLILNFLASGLSLYGLYLFMGIYPDQAMDIEHLPFFIYIAFFIFPLISWYFETR